MALVGTYLNNKQKKETTILSFDYKLFICEVGLEFQENLKTLIK